MFDCEIDPVLGSPLWSDVPYLPLYLHWNRSGDPPFAVLDRDVWREAARYKWHVHDDGHGKIYARRRSDRLYLHRFVMAVRKNLPPSEEHVLVDHYPNRNGLDCREQNLRWATHAINSNNRWRHGRHG